MVYRKTRLGIKKNKFWTRFGFIKYYNKFNKPKPELKWIIKTLKFRLNFNNRTEIFKKKNSWYYTKRKILKYVKLKSGSELYRSNYLSWKKNSLKLFLYLHFLNSLYKQWNNNKYRDAAFFVKNFVGSLFKKGKKNKIQLILLNALKFLCLKYKLSLWAIVLTIFKRLKPSVFLKRYYFKKDKFFTAELVKTAKKSSSVISFIIVNAIKKRKERTLFLKLVSEFNNFFLFKPSNEWKENFNDSLILVEKNLYKEQIRETLIRDRYPYNQQNIGFNIKTKRYYGF